MSKGLFRENKPGESVSFVQWLVGMRYKPTEDELRYIRSRGYRDFADYVPSYEEEGSHDSGDLPRR